MKLFLKISRVLCCASIGAHFITPAASAQFALLEQTVSAGGVTVSRSGGFTLAGTLGQPLAGTLRGGSFVLAGGFWNAAIAVQQAGMPRLRVTRVQSQIAIAWEFGDSDAEIILEESVSLSASAEWSAVVLRRELIGGEVRVQVPANLSNRFFRLRRPDLIP
ncbi:MAG: hypothetical protein HY043_05170 [Verrucomicrobia bacterium]|nr:hypothetical protein [Verrucomicrobiota bacterium]